MLKILYKLLKNKEICKYSCKNFKMKRSLKEHTQDKKKTLTDLKKVILHRVYMMNLIQWDILNDRKDFYSKTHIISKTAMSIFFLWI